MSALAASKLNAIMYLAATVLLLTLLMIPRVDGALRATERAWKLNKLGDTDGDKNFPLRPHQMASLSDMLKIEWTCNATQSTNGVDIGMQATCDCTQQLVQEGGDEMFYTCCQQIYNWMESFKWDTDKVSKIIYGPKYEASQPVVVGEGGKPSDVDELINQYRQDVDTCINQGKDFGQPRTDKLSGSTLLAPTLTPTLVAALTSIALNL